MLALAGRFVATEQAEPSMGPNARLDIVEYPCQGGGSAAYDVSVVSSALGAFAVWERLSVRRCRPS